MNFLGAPTAPGTSEANRGARRAHTLYFMEEKVNFFSPHGNGSFLGKFFTIHRPLFHSRRSPQTGVSVVVVGVRTEHRGKQAEDVGVDADHKREHRDHWATLLVLRLHQGSPHSCISFLCRAHPSPRWGTGKQRHKVRKRCRHQGLSTGNCKRNVSLNAGHPWGPRPGELPMTGFTRASFRKKNDRVNSTTIIPLHGFNNQREQVSLEIRRREHPRERRGRIKEAKSCDYGLGRRMAEAQTYDGKGRVRWKVMAMVPTNSSLTSCLCAIILGCSWCVSLSQISSIKFSTWHTVSFPYLEVFLILTLCVEVERVRCKFYFGSIRSQFKLCWTRNTDKVVSFKEQV